jgi:hypothetical protein
MAQVLRRMDMGMGMGTMQTAYPLSRLHYHSQSEFQFHVIAVRHPASYYPSQVEHLYVPHPANHETYGTQRRSQLF